MLSLNVYVASDPCSPLVNADGVGGDQQYEAMKDEFNAFYENASIERNSLYQQQSAIELHQKCYCTEILHPQRMNEKTKSWQCWWCFKMQTDRSHFRCFSDLCLFKRLTQCWYHICPSCFNSIDSESKASPGVEEQGDGKGAGFICSKFRSHMNVIS